LIYEGCCVIRSRLLAIPTVVKLALFIQKTWIYRIIVVPHIKLIVFYCNPVIDLGCYFLRIWHEPGLFNIIRSIFIYFVFCNLCFLPSDCWVAGTLFALDLWAHSPTLQYIQHTYIFWLYSSNSTWKIEAISWLVFDFFFLLGFHLLPFMHKWYKERLQKMASIKKKNS
jgi:hypothetical protein